MTMETEGQFDPRNNLLYEDMEAGEEGESVVLTAHPEGAEGGQGTEEHQGGGVQSGGRQRNNQPCFMFGQQVSIIKM